VNAQFSPDGNRLAFQSTRSDKLQIWTADADGANAQQLTFIEGSAGTPRWSPDSQTIAFDSVRDSQWDVYVIGASGSRPRQMTFGPADDIVPGFSRDGSRSARIVAETSTSGK
jgi:Tol biopolymer transport system component